ncbi:MAG TPA: hypothetical protein VGO14_11890 [Solirubrobacteraceae bacterium]|jgi:hypothetical protein|nr:hypothetical protein [Solirubrobacteraceae bacterium]
MARITVTAEERDQPDTEVLLDEWIYPDHLCDDEAAAQLIERIGWAVTDAYDVERRQHARAAVR